MRRTVLLIIAAGILMSGCTSLTQAAKPGALESRMREFDSSGMITP